ncbi:MAG: glycosyltransferase [Thermoplasmata archaeon]
MTSTLMLLSKPFAGDTRVNREALTLHKAGFKVKVLCWDRQNEPTKSYRWMDSIDVNHVGPRCGERDLFSFLVKLPIFWLSGFVHGLQSATDIVHAHDFDTLPLAVLLSKIKGSGLIYDAHESYADMISDDAPSFLVSFVRRFERFLMRSVDAVITSNQKVSERIRAEKATVVMNCPSASEFQRLEHQSKYDTRTLRFGYFGSLEPGRFLIEAMDAISDSANWKLVIGGDGTLRNDVRNKTAVSDRIEYLGTLSHVDALRESSKCTVLLVMFDPSNYNNLIGAPNRLFEALFLGVPPLVTEGTLAGDIVLKEDCGFVCKYSKKDFESLLVALAQDPQKIMLKGKNGMNAFEREYNWEKQSERLVEVYRAI